MSVTSLSHCARWRLLPESSSSITGCRVDCNRVNVSLKHRLQSRLHRMLHINATRSQGGLKKIIAQFFYWVEHYQNSTPRALKSDHSNQIITVNSIISWRSFVRHKDAFGCKLSAVTLLGFGQHYSIVRLRSLTYILIFSMARGAINQRATCFDPTVNAL